MKGSEGAGNSRVLIRVGDVEIDISGSQREVDAQMMDIREGDVGAILGWGFAPWSGGPFSWLDILGSPYAAERCDQLHHAYGDRFACPDLLRSMASKGQSFYGQAKKAQSAA